MRRGYTPTITGSAYGEYDDPVFVSYGQTNAQYPYLSGSIADYGFFLSGPFGSGGFNSGMALHAADGTVLSPYIDIQEYSAAVIPDSIAEMPEPATWAMMLLGFSAVGWIARRSRKTKVSASYT